MVHQQARDTSMLTWPASGARHLINVGGFPADAADFKARHRAPSPIHRATPALIAARRAGADLDDVIADVEH